MKGIFLLFIVILKVIHAQGESIRTNDSKRQDNNAVVVVDQFATCQHFSSSVCQGTVYYNVYENETYDQQMMSNLASRLITLTNIPGIPATCRDAATQLICGEYFPKCEIMDGTSNAISVPPCNSLCLTVKQECSVLLGLNANLLNCNKIDPHTNNYAYPTQDIEYMLPDGTLRKYKCNDMIPVDFYPNLVTNGGFEQFNNRSVGVVEIAAWNVSNDFAEGLFITKDNVTASLSNVVRIDVAKQYEGSDTYALQQHVILNRQEKLPIKLSGSGKTERTGPNEEGLIITINIFHQDGSSETGMIQFLNESQDYHLKEVLINPQKPVHSVTVKIFKNTIGTAFVDNVAVQEKVQDPGNQVFCIAPYLLPNPKRNESGEDPCKIACPAPIYDHPKLVRFTLHFQLALSWLSLLAVTFLLVTWIMFPWKRKYPSRLVINFSISTWILSLRFAVMSFYEINDTMCENETTILRSSSSSLCVFTGITYTFGTLGIITWWFCIVVSTYVMIRFHMKRDTFQWLEKYFHLGSWAITLCGVLLSLFGSGYSAGSSIGGCWINGKDNGWWQLGIFFIPLGFALFISFFLIGHAIYIIHSSTVKDKKGNKQAYLRLGGFILIIMGTLIITFLYRFSSYGREAEIRKQFEQYAVCKSIGYSDCGKAPHLSSIVLFLHQVCVASQGIFFFIFFIKKDILMAWKERLTKNKIISRYFSGNTKNSIEQDRV